jgi:hypothetical protein
MARELRFSKENIHHLLEGMDLIRKDADQQRKARRLGKVNYEPASQDQYYKELKSSQ